MEGKFYLSLTATKGFIMKKTLVPWCAVMTNCHENSREEREGPRRKI
jgi:hypothetical protein